MLVACVDENALAHAPTSVIVILYVELQLALSPIKYIVDAEGNEPVEGFPDVLDPSTIINDVAVPFEENSNVWATPSVAVAVAVAP